MTTPQRIGFHLRSPSEEEEEDGMVNLIRKDEPAMQENACCLMEDAC